jgi:hypothetical protein
MQVKVYFEVYPGQRDGFYFSPYPLSGDKLPGYKRYVANIEVPENDGSDAIPVPKTDIKLEEIDHAENES